MFRNQIGDVNNDGAVTAADVQVLHAYLTEGGSVPYRLDLADVDLDMDVDTRDLELLASTLGLQSNGDPLVE